MAITGSRSNVAGRCAGLALVAAILVLAACVANPGGGGTSPSQAGPTRVTGTLVANAPAGPGTPARAKIELPDARVFLIDERGNKAGEAATQLDGRFEIDVAAHGRYRLCYEIQAVASCGPRLRAAGGTLWMRTVAVAPKSFIHGRVLTGDGRPCWVFDSFFGLDVSTRVSAAPAGSGGPPQAGARANVQGEYALFGLEPARYDVTAQCEEATVAATADKRGAVVARDLVLPNRAPVVRTAAAFAGSRSLVQASPGATVDLRSAAVDPDGDAIEYMWRTLDGSGAVAAAGASARWEIPASEGLRSVYLMARDGRGGFTYRRIDLQGARSNRVTASGRAVDEATGEPVGDAAVTFGSASGRTDGRGWFEIASEPRDDSRYVLNIRHPDYALTSRVLERSARDDSYEMIPVQVGTAAAGSEIRLLDRASGSLCGSPAFQRAKKTARRAERRLRPMPADFADDRPEAERQLNRLGAAEPTCMPRGAEIVLPAGALVDSRGGRATGSVRATVATLNPARRALPGDYSVLPRGGDSGALLSFGAVDVRFTDAAGQPLDLKRGSSAEIRLPVRDDQLADAPPTMKMWSYDEENGRWLGEGTARLVRAADGAFYVGETRHFSAINMDIELNRPNATCVRFRIDAAFDPWRPLTLRAYVTFGGTSSQAQETVLDTSLYHSIRAVPYAPGNTLRLQLRGVYNGVPQVLLDDVVQLGPPRPQMTGPALFPPDPYAECDDAGVLSPTQGTMPDYGDMDATGRPAFLTGPAGTFNPTTPDTTAYYTRLDTTGSNPASRNTLGLWWGANGFDTATGASLGGTNEANAAYTNHNDLGFGRDMHCLERSGGRLACYVTNYGLPDQSVANANAASLQTAALRGATVTMEYEPTLGVNAVRFYVYNGGVTASQRVNFADLDGLGPKPVPYLCMVCHGGTYNGTLHDVAQSRFREFDLPSFVYPLGRTFNADFTGNTLLASEITAFAKLNHMVRNAQPLIGASQPTPIGALIDRWYPLGFPSTLAPVKPVEPSGWASAANGYHDVHAKSCRTCHLARDGGNPNAFFVFNTASQFSIATDAVCGDPTLVSPLRRRVMPNAYVTYRNFWADPNRVLQFEALMNPVASNCGS